MLGSVFGYSVCAWGHARGDAELKLGRREAVDTAADGVHVAQASSISTERFSVRTLLTLYSKGSVVVPSAAARLSITRLMFLRLASDTSLQGCETRSDARAQHFKAVDTAAHVCSCRMHASPMRTTWHLDGGMS